MILIRYSTAPEPKIEEERYEGKPYLYYRECSDGLYLEVVTEEESLEDVKEAIEEGELPDAVLSVLGIEAEGESLEEICDQLKERGLNCEMRAYEEGEKYCEELRVELGRGGGKLVKVVIEGDSVRTFPHRGKSYVRFTGGRVPKLEVTVPSSALEAIFKGGDKMKSALALVVPALKEAELEDPVDVIQKLEESGTDYKICIERRGESITWTLE